MQHGEVIGTISDGDSLVDGDAVVGCEGGKKGAFLRCVDNRECGDEFSCQGLCCRVDFELISY